MAYPDEPMNRGSGNVMLRSSDGITRVLPGPDVDLFFDAIKAVGISHLCDVAEHRINRVFNSVSHYLRFVDGAEVKLAYNLDGDLLELTARGVAVSVQDGDTLIFTLTSRLL